MRHFLTIFPLLAIIVFAGCSNPSSDLKFVEAFHDQAPGLVFNVIHLKNESKTDITSFVGDFWVIDGKNEKKGSSFTFNSATKYNEVGNKKTFEFLPTGYTIKAGTDVYLVKMVFGGNNTQYFVESTPQFVSDQFKKELAEGRKLEEFRNTAIKFIVTSVN